MLTAPNPVHLAEADGNISQGATWESSASHARGIVRAGFWSLLLCAVAVVAAAPDNAATAGDGKPNILFVLTDQWRASATGYVGDPNVQTPNLDQLARQGWNFRNAVSVCPVCTPYRASLYMNVAPWGRRQPKFNREYRAIRTDRYTYVRGLEGPWLLYDNQSDPHQLNNLVGQPDYEDLVAQLDRRRQEQLDRIGDPFRPGPHYVQHWGYELGAHGSVPYGTPESIGRQRAGQKLQLPAPRTSPRIRGPCRIPQPTPSPSRGERD